MRIRNKRDELLVAGAVYTIIRVMGEHGDFNLYVVVCEGKKYVLKEFRGADSFWACIKCHEILEKTEIAIPELITFDEQIYTCIEQYISGIQASDYIMQGNLDSCYLDMVKNMADCCEKQGIALNYYPTKFIVHRNTLVYVGCECYELTGDNCYEKKGQIFWMNASALIEGFVTERMKAISTKTE